MISPTVQVPSSKTRKVILSKKDSTKILFVYFGFILGRYKSKKWILSELSMSEKQHLVNPVNKLDINHGKLF